MSSDIENQLLEAFSTVLALDDLAADQDLLACGANSISVVHALGIAAERGLDIPIALVYACRTVRAIAREVLHLGPAATRTGRSTFPLTPTGQFLTAEGRFGEHYNMCNLWDFDPERLDLDRLLRVASLVIRGIPTLDVRLVRTADGIAFRQVQGHDTVVVERVDLRGMPPAQYSEAVERAIARAHRSIVFAEDEPLLRIVVFEGDVRPWKLFVISHHLYFDGVGFRILLREITRAYEADARNESVVCAAANVPSDTWLSRLTEYADVEAPSELPYWRGLPWAAYAAFKFPNECAPSGSARPRFSDAVARRLHHHARSLDDATLQELCRDQCATRRQLNAALSKRFFGLDAAKQLDIVILAIGRTLVELTGARHLLVDTFESLRGPVFADCDMSRVVGYVNEIVPLPLEVPTIVNATDALDDIRRQRLMPPRRGIGFRALRYLSGDPAIRAELGAWPEPRVAVNYVASMQRDLKRDLLDLPLSREWPGSPMDESRTPYWLSFSVSALDGVVTVDTRHDPKIINYETCERASQMVLRCIKDMCLEVSPQEAAQ